MKKSLTIIIIIYLIISSMYIGAHIDYHVPRKYYEQYQFEKVSKTHNNIRLIMGLPKATDGYDLVSTKYLSEIAVKMIIAISLWTYLFVNRLKNILKDENSKYKKLKIGFIIFRIMISLLIIGFVFLFIWYMGCINSSTR